MPLNNINIPYIIPSYEINYTYKYIYSKYKKESGIHDFYRVLQDRSAQYLFTIDFDTDNPTDPIITNKNKSTLGKRITSNYSNLSQSDQRNIKKALQEYLKNKISYSSKKQLSPYYNKKDFEYQICRFTDTNTHSRNKSDTLGVDSGGDLSGDNTVSGSDSGGDYDKVISNNMLLRLQSTDDHGKELIPYHSFYLPYELIKEALSTISKKYYIYIHLFYFDMLEPQNLSKKLDAKYKSIFQIKNNNEFQLSEKESNKSERSERHNQLQKLRDRKSEAINILFDTIQIIQSIKIPE